jgi:transposase
LETHHYSPWFCLKTRRKTKKRDFKKIHVALEIHGSEKPIYSIEATKAARHDSPMLIPLLKRITGNIGDVCGDKGVASRRNAPYIDDRGGTPFLLMKKNSTSKSKGCPAWHNMYVSRKNDEKAWDKRYHKRSNSEAGFGSFKHQTTSYLSSRNRKCQDNEVWLKTIAYNIKQLVHRKVRLAMKRGEL